MVSQAVSTTNGARVLVAELLGVDAKAMQEAAVKLQASMGPNAAVVLGTQASDGKANFVAAFGAEVRGWGKCEGISL